MRIEVNGRVIELSEAGWMVDMSQWDEDVGLAVAREVEKLEMTEEHWIVVNEVRAYFQEYGVVPEQRVLSKIMKVKYGPERSTQSYFYALFPYGIIKSANKIAGLPRPKGCS
ncbi:MAG: TusE/DsrC/DsvC family sulfur relay protein [Alphaproteobacteria bacterium]|nr:TusE/DsrC/DsvC family sulfur relay protein [Alphaproteobacteria bacterium]